MGTIAMKSSQNKPTFFENPWPPWPVSWLLPGLLIGPSQLLTLESAPCRVQNNKVSTHLEQYAIRGQRFSSGS